MTLDELKIRIKEICAETLKSNSDIARNNASKKLGLLFHEYREAMFKISHRVQPHWHIEKDLKEHSPLTYALLRTQSLAFITCSCGSREDSCPEDGNGNFSTFVFTREGDVFRIVEKKA